MGRYGKVRIRDGYCALVAASQSVARLDMEGNGRWRWEMKMKKREDESGTRSH